MNETRQIQPNDPAFRPLPAGGCDQPPRRVAVLVPPLAQSLDVTGPLDVFAQANALSGGPRYATELIACSGTLEVATTSIRLVADRWIGDPGPPIDTLLVAGAPDLPALQADAAVIAWLQDQAGRVRRMASVCTGAFLLGEAGLLDGRSVTTHWIAAGALARRFPRANVAEDRIFVRDGPIYTSAGVTAGIDLALALLEEDAGRAIALAVARQLVVFLKRPGGQSQFSATLTAQMGPAPALEAVQAWMAEHLAADLTLPAIADQAGMSVRTLSRVFREAAGMTPIDFVELLRVEAARRMLETTAEPLKRVASRCGFGSADSMRRVFLRRIGVGAADYRTRFSGGEAEEA
ncbi:MAG: GlxA family transcriptional regulator [Acetobacteraceae bacterium]|nr:GlxA family transcriptional regulator [Acetobacteraceae bacterium]